MAAVLRGPRRNQFDKINRKNNFHILRRFYRLMYKETPFHLLTRSLNRPYVSNAGKNVLQFIIWLNSFAGLKFALRVFAWISIRYETIERTYIVCRHWHGHVLISLKEILNESVESGRTVYRRYGYLTDSNNNNILHIRRTRFDGRDVLGTNLACTSDLVLSLNTEDRFRSTARYCQNV